MQALEREALMKYFVALGAAVLLAPVTFAQYGSSFVIPQSPAASYGRDVSVVQSWYQRYLGRNPDRGGMETYVGQLQAGASPTELQARILGSDEFYRRWGNTSSGFINGVYRTALGQVPSRQAQLYWKRQLWRNPDREQVALGILESSGVSGSGEEPDPFGTFGRGYPLDHSDGSPAGPPR